MGGNPPTAHDPNREDIGGVFPPAYPCLICPCIATPGTEEAYDDGVELVLSFVNHFINNLSPCVGQYPHKRGV